MDSFHPPVCFNLAASTAQTSVLRISKLSPSYDVTSLFMLYRFAELSLPVAAVKHFQKYFFLKELSEHVLWLSVAGLGPSNAAKLPALQNYRNPIHMRRTSSGDPSAGNNSKSTDSSFSIVFRLFNDYSGVLTVAGGIGIGLYTAGSSDMWAKAEIKNAKITFEAEMRNLKTVFEAEKTVMREKLAAEQTVMREKLAAEQTVMREKLAAADLVYDADKKAIQSTMEAKVAEAELRAANQFLVYGFSDQYTAYQKKLDEKLKKSGAELDPGETKSEKP